MPEIDPFEREIDAWMKEFAVVDRAPRLPDPSSLWIKAKLLQSAAAAERAAGPITRAQIAAYLIVASGWSVLVMWKWAALQAWINSFTPTHIIMGAAGVQTAQSLSLTFLMALIVLASVTVILAFHTILAEE
jgi:hypothetical protein